MGSGKRALTKLDTRPEESDSFHVAARVKLAVPNSFLHKHGQCQSHGQTEEQLFSEKQQVNIFYNTA